MPFDWWGYARTVLPIFLCNIITIRMGLSYQIKVQDLINIDKIILIAKHIGVVIDWSILHRRPSVWTHQLLFFCCRFLLLLAVTASLSSPPRPKMWSSCGAWASTRTLSWASSAHSTAAVRQKPETLLPSTLILILILHSAYLTLTLVI